MKEKLFTQALATRWLPNPKTFKPEVETLWHAMTDGTSFGLHGRLLRFKGGLFADWSESPLLKGGWGISDNFTQAGGISNDEILERLVALNAERAKEKRNGLIRWLRPEYQAPETIKAQALAPLQGIIEGLETEEATPIRVEQQPLPKKFKEHTCRYS
jgi:hypothetical protein